MSTTKQTHDHHEIKDWVENVGGIPAIVKDTGNAKGDGILRIHFPKHSENKSELEEVDWDKFFEEFEQNELDFLYQEKKANGEPSTFHKFIERV